MAKKGGPSIKGMHIAFGLGSFLLVICTVYVFVQDHYGREFVRFQEKYDAAEIKRLRMADEAAAKELSSEPDVEAAHQKAEAELAAAQSQLAQKQGDIQHAKEEIRKVDDKLQLATRQLNFLKADRDAIKSQVDTGLRGVQDFENQNKLVDAQFAVNAQLKAEKDAAFKRITGIDEGVKDAQKDLDRVVGQKSDLDQKIKKAAGNPIINIIKDAPGLDFVAPRRHIEQVLLNNLPENVFFANHLRVDRCVTCHKAVDNPDSMYQEKDAAKLDPVLRSHPRLDLFVSANSKHPYKQFGCTICHQGQSNAVSFARAAHMPRNKKQGEEWEKKFNWEPQEFWDEKMLPMQYVEASCLKCHKGLDDVPEAAKLNEGRHLFTDRGCTNCHMGASGDKDMAWVGRIGPDLRRIGEKTNIDWARHWIENPWSFRPSTKMPRVFGLENRKALTLNIPEGHLPRDPVEVEAIATYLFTTSKLREQTQPEPKEGNVETGKKLFSAIGCLGCHSTHDAADKFEFNQHGPDLSRIGDKVSPGWLFTWLKNPRHYWPETKMPNLRLSDQEAQDLTSYLLKAMVKEKPAPIPSAPEAAFDAIILDKLSATIPETKIKEILADGAGLMDYSYQKFLNNNLIGLNSLMARVKFDKGQPTDDGEWNFAQIAKIKEILSQSPEPKKAVKAFYAGEMLIQHNGCFGCHNIQGYTYSPLPCVNLVGEADKDIEKYDFGKTEHVNSKKTKWDWFYNKIARPRVYDVGKLEIIPPFDRLRMPWFGYAKPEKAEEKNEGEHSTYAPENNPDLEGDVSHGLNQEQIEALVTHLLSLTTQAIPMEMQHQPSPQDIAIDRGHRTIRGLNCTGCHLVSLDNGTPASPDTLPMEAFVAMLAPDAKKFTGIPGNGIYLNEDILSLKYEEKDPKGEPSELADFLNLKRGTYLTGGTIPILLAEKTVQPNPLKSAEHVNFSLERKGKGANWVKYEELVTEDQFAILTRAFFENEETARKAYNKLKTQFADKFAYERMAGTAALQQAGLLGTTEADQRRMDKTFMQPVLIKVRLTRGEGRIVDHIIKLEGKLGTPSPSQQQAPPSLSFEGGKVQPDWLYQFLHNVQTLRTGLNIRMPSFWTDGPYSKYKVIYPAGHLSAVDPAKRNTGIQGEPVPGTDSLKVNDVPDDSAQLVDFFVTDSGQKTYGFQPLSVTSADDRKLYEEGSKLIFSSDKDVVMACTGCHAFGKKEPAEPHWAPNLAMVKRRLKGDWLRRFLANPSGIYPWANMPNNFGFDWSLYNHDFSDPVRGIIPSEDSSAKVKKNDDERVKDSVDKIRAVHYFLMHSGEGEIGAETK